MKQKKVMRGWQFGTIVALLAVMFVTMFMPAVKVLEDGAFTRKSYSALAMMIKGKALQEFVKTNAKVMLWVVYVLLLVILVVTILSFLLKWGKSISLIPTIVYGVIATGIFGYMRFFYLNSLVSKTADKGSFWENLAKKIVSTVMGAEITYSFGFMLAFVLALVLLIVSVVSMFTGNPKNEEAYADDDEEEYDDDYADDYNSITGGDATVDWASMQPDTTEVEEVQPHPVKKVQPIVKPRVGQVVCTKGISVGQGLMLPEDKKVIVGKSTRNANFVISNQKISNVHCSIRYNATRNTYTVKDHSTNGTYVNKVRLPKDTAMEYPAGTILSFADGNDEVTLK